MKLLRIILLAFFLASCSAKPAMNTPIALQATTAQAAGTDSGYPAPVSPTTSNPGYPVPENTAPAPTLVLPARDASLASIKGRLLENGKPLENADLYLANLLINEQGKEVAFTFDPSSSPRVSTDQNGEFEFYNLKPGQYAFVYDLVVQSVLLLDPKTGEQMKFVLEEGQAYDAGNLDYSDLPK
jgi:protocatechuate 3,4-dioxygenase beta subunit